MPKLHRSAALILALANIPVGAGATPPSWASSYQRDATPPSSGQWVSPSLNQVPWDANKITALVANSCTIPPTYIRVERRWDGLARIDKSANVTKEQSDCARNVVQSQGLSVFNN